MKKQLGRDEIIELIMNGCAPISIRNRGDYVVNEIISMTPLCDGSLAERLYWIKNGLISRPNCAHCSIVLDKKSFRNGGDLGYRTFCSTKCSASSKLRKDQVKATSIEKYGVEHPSKSKNVQDKKKMTNIERYGDSNPMRWSSDAFKSIMIDMYGGINCLSSPILKDISVNKIQRQKRDNFISTKLSSIVSECEKNGLTLVDDISTYDGQNSTLKWLCNKCNKETIRSFRNPKCDYCSPKSRPEFEIYQYVTELLGDGSVISNDRTEIKPLELDIYIPEKKLAIELNGVYWHSTKFQNNKNYHLNKTQLCLSRGIKLIHVWDHQWYEKQKIIKSKIAVDIGVGINKIFARNCSIGKIPEELANYFIEENHLQGSTLATYAIALFYKDAIVGVMTFGHPRFSKHHQWELIRYATMSHCQIIGGASRLLTEFKRRMQPENIISYADRRVSFGNVYDKIGMTLIRETPPGYFYTNHRGERVSRYKAMKKNLKRLLGHDIDLSLTEEEIMANDNWYRVYDAGQLVYEWKI